MILLNQMKITLFKKQNNFKKKDFQLNPDFYWKVAVVVALTTALLSAFFGYRLFMRINQESILLTANKDEVAGTLNQDRILKALNYFSEREKKSSRILNSSLPIIDPSL